MAMFGLGWWDRSPATPRHDSRNKQILIDRFAYNGSDAPPARPFRPESDDMSSPPTPAVSVRWWCLTNPLEQRVRWRRVGDEAGRRLDAPATAGGSVGPS